MNCSLCYIFGRVGHSSLLAVLAVIALVLAPGCERGPGSRGGGGGGGVDVVATTGMVADMVRAVAGDRARVAALIGPGIDPHLFKPTRDDTVALTRAHAVFANGLGLEGKLGDALDRVAVSGRPVVRLADALLTHTDPRVGGADPNDPHVWMDPVRWGSLAPRVSAALKTIDPAGAVGFDERAAEYARECERLDSYAREVLGTIPPQARVLVTAHDAFRYFGERYGLEVLGVQGVSTESQAALADIERLVELLVSRRVPAVFFESTVSDRSVRALIDGAAARGHRVVLGGELFSDAMGPRGTYEGTYLGMIDHNVTTIARALGGRAPARGMDGRLAAPQGGE